MVSYTPILKLTQPDFDQVPWDEQINDDLSVLDAAFGKFMVIPGMSGVWQNATAYLLGQVLVDSVNSSIWQCAVGHTSAASPTTFAQDRAAHPTYWSSQSVPQNYVPVGGGIMTGPLTLSGTPTGTNQAATKAYVDGVITRAGGPFLALGSGGVVNGTVEAGGFELSDSHARIYSDSNYTYFVQDSANWYWRYTRGIGTMTYISGSGVDLFHISAAGDVVAQGSIFGNSMAVTNSVTAHTFINAVHTDFLLTASIDNCNIQFATNNYLTYDVATADVQLVLNSRVVVGYDVPSGILSNFFGAMAGLDAYVVISDSRMKSDIVPAQQGLDAVVALRPVMFKRQGKTRTELGFIAQDVQEVLPEAVSEVPTSDKTGTMLGVSMDPIVAALVNAVKELQARIAVLEAK